MAKEQKDFIKDKHFLSQIPEWEKKYKESDSLEITYSKDDWIKADAIFTENKLEILGEAVIEDWETPYMKELAAIAAANGGIICEVGYGMGISAGFIQKHNISKHIIIEANTQVADKARDFARNAVHPVEILEGLWQDVIDSVPDESLDGILFDSYPLTEEELYQNHFFFSKAAYRKLKRGGGGVLTYYSDEIRGFGKAHMKKLLEAGFKKENISGKIVKVTPPKDCSYWKANTILAPRVIKE